MPVPSNDVRLINSVFISKRSTMCGHPYEHMPLPYEYAEYVESSIDTGIAEVKEKPQHVERAFGGTYNAWIQSGVTSDPA